jgi:hypothetical protein
MAKKAGVAASTMLALSLLLGCLCCGRSEEQLHIR